MEKVLSISTTAQNLLKIASLDKAFSKQKQKGNHKICHFVNPYNDKLPVNHFSGISLPNIDFQIQVDKHNNKVQNIANLMLEFEKVLDKFKPVLVILTGFQDITVACALAASKMNIKLAHIDSGLRSFDKNSNDETNRILTDVLCKYYIVSEHSGTKNLREEGKDNQDNILFAGNLLADTLIKYWDRIEKDDISNLIDIGKDDDYLLFVTASPAYDIEMPLMAHTFEMINNLSQKCPVFVVVSEETKKVYEKWGLLKKIADNVRLIPHHNYLEFLCIMYNARAVITNSTTIQEETTYLGVQCITILNYTERPVTMDIGTNHLVGKDPAKAEKTALDILDRMEKPGRLPENWDGKAGKRIVEWVMVVT